MKSGILEYAPLEFSTRFWLFRESGKLVSELEFLDLSVPRSLYSVKHSILDVS
jgi:hypothetical protein